MYPRIRYSFTFVYIFNALALRMKHYPLISVAYYALFSSAFSLALKWMRNLIQFLVRYEHNTAISFGLLKYTLVPPFQHEIIHRLELHASKCQKSLDFLPVSIIRREKNRNRVKFSNKYFVIEKK